MPADLCKPIHDIINHFTSISSSESGKCGMKGEKLQKFEYLENGKSFSGEKKSIACTIKENIVLQMEGICFERYLTLFCSRCFRVMGGGIASWSNYQFMTSGKFF